jgi:hypothetical protein
MRAWFRRLTLCACLLLASAAQVVAQDKGPAEKAEKNGAPPAPAKYERDGSVMLVHYLIAGIATLLIMVLICMPIRRD